MISNAIRRAAGTGSGVAAVLMAQAAAAGPQDWPTAGGDPGGTHHSALTQITPANVARLQPAWVYHMKPPQAATPQANEADRAQRQAEQAGPEARAQGPRRQGEPAARGGQFAASESIPLVVNGVMYLATPYARIVALDAATGREKWVHQLPEGVQPAIRGIEYWPGRGKVPPALIFGTSDGMLRSIRASDGRSSPGFGANGVLDLKTDDVMVGGMNKPYRLSSPPIVFDNLVITGSSVGEANGGSRGDVRAWNAATGKRVWTFRTVPAQGEPGYETWANDSGHNRSGVNAWGLLAVDAKRGIVYLPLGAPTNDRVGVDRPGNNLFSSSIVAADARTGRYLWHFQIVHHDIWDNDVAAPPILFDVHKGGRTIPAVGMPSKNGLLFILDRVTGAPVYPVTERPVPPSDVPGEIASPTQPFPSIPPLTRMSMTASQLSTLTPEHAAFCKKLVEQNNIAMGGPYNPPTLNRPMVYFPGSLGGVNWGGGSFDPASGLYLVNAFQLGQIMQIGQESNGNYANRGRLNGRFWDPATRLPCQEGPWGEMVAVNVNTGQIAWRSVHGVSDNLPPALRNTGRPSIGGPITTAGGLTFIGATDDGRFRAYETATGREVWTFQLPASAHTNPITYAAAGKQFVAIVSTGGSFLASPVASDQLTAFALK